MQARTSRSRVLGGRKLIGTLTHENDNAIEGAAIVVVVIVRQTIWCKLLYSHRWM